jgi:hypothetical protein
MKIPEKTNTPQITISASVKNSGRGPRDGGVMDGNHKKKRKAH